jgi:hypothetical protein
MHHEKKRLGIMPEVAREYLRVSKDSDGRGKSPDQQHGENGEAVARRGWTLHADSYRDDGISASRYARQSRAGFDRLIADLDADRFGAQVLVMGLSILASSTARSSAVPAIIAFPSAVVRNQADPLSAVSHAVWLPPAKPAPSW